MCYDTDIQILYIILAYEIQKYILMIIYHDLVEKNPRNLRLIKTWKSINIIHYQVWNEEKKQKQKHVHPNRYRKRIWQNSVSIHDENSQETSIIRQLSANTRGTCEKPSANILADKRMNAFL